MTATAAPHDPVAEKSVLASVILDNELLTPVRETPLVAQDFYSSAHAQIFDCIEQLSAVGQPVDTVTLRERLASAGKLHAVGGDEYLFNLTNTIPMASNIEAHAKIVREKSIMRRLIATCREVAAGAAAYASADEYLDDAGARLEAALAGRAVRDCASSAAEIAYAVIQEITQPPDPNAPQAIPSGLQTVNAALDGYFPGYLYVFAARPGMGKSAAAYQEAVSCARNGFPSGVWSLEMPKEQLGKRTIAAFARLNNRLLKYERLNTDLARRVTRAADEFAALPLFTTYCPGITIEDLSRQVREQVRKNGIRMAVVDYLQLLRSSRKHDNREQEVSEISRTLKNLAGELRIPIIACAQLNRNAEGRTDKRPQISELRESGAIEQDADAIVFFYREDYYTQGRKPPTNVCEWIISKNRAGSVGFVRTHFAADYTWFDDLAEEPQ